MSKSTKPQVAETKTEQVKTNLPKVEETVKVGALSDKPEDSTATIIDMPKSEAIEKGLVKEPEPKKEKPEYLVKVEQVSEPVETISDKILKFITKSKESDVDLNGFLKETFGSNCSTDTQSKEVMRTIAGLVLANEGKFSIDGDNHLKLGTSFFIDGAPETQYHNLDTVELVVKK